MKIDPYYQQERCSPMTLVSGSIRFVRIFAGFPGEGRQTQAQFSVLLLAISSEALVVRPTLLYGRPIIQSLTVFTLTPKYVTLSDRERSFYVKLCCFVKSSSKFAFFLTR